MSRNSDVSSSTTRSRSNLIRAGSGTSAKKKTAPKQGSPIASCSKIDEKKDSNLKLDQNTIITISSETTVYLNSWDNDESAKNDGKNCLRIDPSHPINRKIPTRERIREWINLIPHDVELPDSEIFDYSDTVYSSDRSLSNLSKRGDDDSTWSFDIEDDGGPIDD